MADNWLIRKLFHRWFLFRRPMTLGVRILVENENREVLLVRHTYISGWYFPGGGVENGEYAEAAAIKELREETNLEIDEGLELLGVYWNRQASRRDHVIFYRCQGDFDIENFTPNREIAEAGFFPVGALPEGTTAATLRRLDEVYQGKKQSVYW